MIWPLIFENVVTLLLSTGLATGFYYFTGSPHSFWWLLLLFNINYLKKNRPPESPK